MKLKLYIYIVMVLLILIGCSSSKETSVEISNITSKPIYTKTSNLTIKIPSGWSKIEDNYEKLFDIWLVNKTNNAVIAFIPIHLDENININSEEEGLEIIKNIMVIKKKSSSEKFEIIEEKTVHANYKNNSFKYLINDKLQNSILFGKEGIYYECIAYFKNDYEPDLSDIKDLIQLQEEVLSHTLIN